MIPHRYITHMLVQAHTCIEYSNISGRIHKSHVSLEEGNRVSREKI